MKNDTEHLTREQIITKLTRLRMLKRTANTCHGAEVWKFRPDPTVQKIRKLYRTRAKHRKSTINKRSEIKGWDTTQLSHDDIILLLQDRVCFYTGLAMSEQNISFDRVDNRYGYELWNVVTCHQNANLAKGILFEDPINPKHLGHITDFTLEFVRKQIVMEIHSRHVVVR